jgi:hypothetical protein
MHCAEGANQSPLFNPLERSQVGKHSYIFMNALYIPTNARGKFRYRRSLIHFDLCKLTCAPQRSPPIGLQSSCESTAPSRWACLRAAVSGENFGKSVLAAETAYRAEFM